MSRHCREKFAFLFALCLDMMVASLETRTGLSVCKLSENFNENSGIIFVILLLGTFRDDGKQFQTLPASTKIRTQTLKIKVVQEFF